MIVCVRGMGELGTAVAHLLFRLGLKVFGTELPNPLAIRRPVCFSEVMNHGNQVVQGIKATRAASSELEAYWSRDMVPVITDDLTRIQSMGIDACVDARMLKQEVDSLITLAPISVGLGPGFHAGKNCNVVIETARGHDLGRLIWEGPAKPNTGIPGNIGGESIKRLIKAPCEGKVRWLVRFGDRVEKNQTVGRMDNDTAVFANTSGIVRGMIDENVMTSTGMKIGDVDPRGESVDHELISEKARLVAYGVFEAIRLLTKDKIYE